MYYPFMLFSRKIRHRPIFSDLKGEPYVADLSTASPLLQDINVRDQERFQGRLEEEMGRQYQWGFSPYLEHRQTLLADCPQMVAEKRFFHLGLDVIVGLDTPLHAPLEAVVQESGYEAGEGNYGGYVLLKHQSPCFETFYSLYGHLRKDTLPAIGRSLSPGEVFARIGDFHENGHWFRHTHIQVITQAGLDQGYITKGYCAETDLAQINGLCPSPIPLFRRF
jgi:hypothetical protein